MHDVTIYMDSSGSNEDVLTNEPIVTAAMISRTDLWPHFDAAWEAVLQHPDFGVPYLHMRECAHWLGPFASWGKDAGRRAAFIDALIGVAETYVQNTMTYRMTPNDWSAVNKAYDLSSESIGPYQWHVIACVGFVEQTFKHDETRQYILEYGEQGQDAVLKEAPTYGYTLRTLRKDIPGSLRTVPAFQIADLVAYEYRLAAIRRAKGDPRPYRRSLLEVERRLKVRGVFQDEELIVRTCRMFPNKMPQRQAPASD
jgi:hypothetical protein